MKLVKEKYSPYQYPSSTKQNRWSTTSILVFSKKPCNLPMVLVTLLCTIGNGMSWSNGAISERKKKKNEKESWIYRALISLSNSGGRWVCVSLYQFSKRFLVLFSLIVQRFKICNTYGMSYHRTELTKKVGIPKTRFVLSASRVQFWIWTYQPKSVRSRLGPKYVPFCPVASPWNCSVE